MKSLDMSQVYKEYKGLWVALKGPNSNEVIASGKSLKMVFKEAQDKGIDIPVVTQIPKKILPIVGPYLAINEF